MRRREFIGILGGAAMWPVAAPAQQGDQVRRLGVLMAIGEADPEAKAWLSEFTKGLSELGWTDGRNLRMDVRWASDVDRMRTSAKELVDLKPDVILGNSTPGTAALMRATQTIPVVFTIVSDPIGSGFVASLHKPGGNITGFSQVQASMTSKWLELLKEIAPGLKHVSMIFNPTRLPISDRFTCPHWRPLHNRSG